MNPPSGFITFLFTDIEGSTKLWEEFPSQMSAALDQHDRLVRHLIEEQGGYIFKTIGDAFCAAFADPFAAVRTSTAIQLALVQEAWPLPQPIKVRMAIHSGIAEHRDQDYFGPTLNRIARIVSAGHGGQILITEGCKQACEGGLNSVITFKSLGPQQLKDLLEPLPLYQVVHPDLPQEFPPLASLSTVSHNLPAQLTTFIGRESVLEQLNKRLKEARLLTLHGTGGCGKTRLALQLGAEVVENYRDGVWLIELAAISDPALVAPELAAVLSLQFDGQTSVKNALVEELRSKQVLLILDNCEHLLGACAELAHEILLKCPHISIVATSRERLNIPGEQLFRVPSLSGPSKGDATELSESVRLFIDRAQTHSPSFSWTKENSRSIVSVCERLDGIPLAIELAAARVRSMSIEDVDHRLDQRFRLLTNADRTALPRQKTLRSLIDWSFDLLTDQEKDLLCRLSVFTGGWTIESATEVCGAGAVDEWEMLDLLTSLVDKSLVIADELQHEGRYHFLETVRQYALERLQQGGIDEWRQRHLAHFVDKAKEMVAGLVGADQGKWLAKLSQDHDNLRAALTFAESRDDCAELGITLAATLGKFWYWRSHLAEGRRWLTYALERSNEETSGKDIILARLYLGAICQRMSDFVASDAAFRAALELAEKMGDRASAAMALNGLGNNAADSGNLLDAKRIYEESVALHRQNGTGIGLASALANLGTVNSDLGLYDEALQRYQETLEIARALDDKMLISNGLQNIGDVYARIGETERAIPILQEGLELCRELDINPVYALFNLGSAHYDLDDAEHAAAYCNEALEISQKSGERFPAAVSLALLTSIAVDRQDFEVAQKRIAEAIEETKAAKVSMVIVYSLRALAKFHAARGNCTDAAIYLGASVRLAMENNIALSPVEMRRVEKTVERIRAKMSDEDFEKMSQSTENLAADEILNRALESLH